MIEVWNVGISVMFLMDPVSCLQNDVLQTPTNEGIVLLTVRGAYPLRKGTQGHLHSRSEIFPRTNDASHDATWFSSSSRTVHLLQQWLVMKQWDRGMSKCSSDRLSSGAGVMGFAVRSGLLRSINSGYQRKSEKSHPVTPAQFEVEGARLSEDIQDL